MAVLEDLSEASPIPPQTGEMDPEDVEDLLDAFYKVDFFARKSEYKHIPRAHVTRYHTVQNMAERRSDGQVTVVGLAIGSCTKQVLLYCGVPSELKALAALIDERSEAAEWIKAASDR